MSHLVAFAYVVGSIVCHQIPERSLHLSGIQLPVCARCTGLYLGGVVGVMVWLARRRAVIAWRSARAVLLVAAAPTALTLATAELGWWDPANGLRALFAAPLGIATGVVVSAGLARDLR